MKPKPTIQIKRQPASGFRVLRAVTSKAKNKRKRAQRAATTADFDDIGEVPGVGVARALVVILLLHVAAIAGIYVHNQWTSNEDQQISKTKNAGKTPLSPALIPGVEHYQVVDGDNYFKIAENKGVSVAELKRLNNNIDVSPGISINIPGRRIAVLPSPDVTQGMISQPMLPPVASDPISIPAPVERPLIQMNDTTSLPGSVPGALTVEANAPAEVVDEPVLIRPRRRPRPAAPPAAVSSGRSHTIVKGDTIWRISKKYGVSQKALMRLNGITDPGKIRLGAKLRIPGS